MFDEINGSAGIQSNMDSMIVIASNRKAGANSVLHCIPKDAEQLEFEIGMNENMIWEDKGPVGSSTYTLLQTKLIECVKKLYNGNASAASGTPALTKQIIQAIQVDKELLDDRLGKPHSKEDINKTLERLVERQDLTKIKRGAYTPSLF